MSKTRLEQMGNFYGFIIPQDLLERLNFQKNDQYELFVENNHLVIAKEDEFDQKFIDLTDEDIDAFSACLESL
jgi:antitoxin component of MazEF toxin-antitoxin module